MTPIRNVTDRERELLSKIKQLTAERDALRSAAQAGLNALVSVLDDDQYANNMSVSGGVYEGVECKAAIKQIQAALKEQA